MFDLGARLANLVWLFCLAAWWDGALPDFWLWHLWTLYALGAVLGVALAIAAVFSGWLFCVKHGYGNWFLAMLAFMIGVTLLTISGFGPGTLTASGTLLVFSALLYAAWRTVRRLVLIAFGLLLVAVSYLGEAWRGDLANRYERR